MLTCSNLVARIKLKMKLMAFNKSNGAGNGISSSSSVGSSGCGVEKGKKGWTFSGRMRPTSEAKGKGISTLSSVTTSTGPAPNDTVVSPRTSTSTASPSHGHLPLPLHSILTTLLIPHTVPSHPAHTHSSTPFNVRIKTSPIVITYPTTTPQIQALVRVTASLGLKISVRSGGHSYAAYGLGGGRDGAVVIDLRGWQGVKLLDDHDDKDASNLSEKETVLIHAGGGVRLGNLAASIFALAQRGTPHGTCPLVGIGGHALYGGFGLSSRKWGLALDSIVSLSGVLADGSTFTASETENKDLFWALRGAGPSFAVVTGFVLKSYRAPKVNIVYEYIWYFPMSKQNKNENEEEEKEAGTYPATKAYLLAQAFGLSPRAVKNLGMGIRLEKGGFFRVYGVYYGERVDFETVIGGLVQRIDKVWEDAVRGNPEGGIGRGRETLVREMGYLESLAHLAEGQSLTNNVLVPSWDDLNRGGSISSPFSSPRPPHTKPAFDPESLSPGMSDHFLAKSLVQDSSTRFSSSTLDALFSYLYTTGEASSCNGIEWFIIANLYGGGGGESEITNKPPPLSPGSTSCYPHRDCEFVWQFYGSAKAHGESVEGLKKGNSGAQEGGRGGDMLVPFMNDMVRSVTRMFPEKEEEGWGSYAPYVDPTLVDEDEEGGRQVVERYFDHKGSLRKLEELKGRWDGGEVFWCEVGVRPAKEVEEMRGGVSE